MTSKSFLAISVVLLSLSIAAVWTQNQEQILRTRFSCNGRPSGYYADMQTGCQVYHMCDGLGRQFSYTCPNTTLFQQRMLICDHWYMVNCSQSEKDFDANLLIGQRDKPFVSDDEMRLRTPRPDILSVPLNSNYYDGLKEAESKYPVHPGNNIVGVPDTISSSNNNGLDSAKTQYRPPTSWSAGIGYRPNQDQNYRPNQEQNNRPNQEQNYRPNQEPNNRPNQDQNYRPNQDQNNRPNQDQNKRPNQDQNYRPNHEQNHRPNQDQNYRPNQDPSNRPTIYAPTDDLDTQDSQAGVSIKPVPTAQSKGTTDYNPQTSYTPSQELLPPLSPRTTTEQTNSEEYNLDIRMIPKKDPVVKFINRFDPNSPDSIKTAMTRTEIVNLNRQLPQGQDFSGEERTPRKQKINGKNTNDLDITGKNVNEPNRFDSVNYKSNPKPTTQTKPSVPEPERTLLPPKVEFTPFESTTTGPPVYYEWKWAAPAFDLEPPKVSNITYNITEEPQGRNVDRNPFRGVTRPTTEPSEVKPFNTEYNISSYYVPDYLFPLDKYHPGYGDGNSNTSFQENIIKNQKVKLNSACPECDPLQLEPGKCEPCIVRR